MPELFSVLQQESGQVPVTKNAIMKRTDRRITLMRLERTVK